MLADYSIPQKGRIAQRAKSCPPWFSASSVFDRIFWGARFWCDQITLHTVTSAARRTQWPSKHAGWTLLNSLMSRYSTVPGQLTEPLMPCREGHVNGLVRVISATRKQQPLLQNRRSSTRVGKMLLSKNRGAPGSSPGVVHGHRITLRDAMVTRS